MYRTNIYERSIPIAANRISADESIHEIMVSLVVWHGGQREPDYLYTCVGGFDRDRFKYVVKAEYEHLSLGPNLGELEDSVEIAPNH